LHYSTQNNLASQFQWVETNQSNFCIYPTDICLLQPHGTTLKALIQMLQMLDGFVSSHPHNLQK